MIELIPEQLIALALIVGSLGFLAGSAFLYYAIAKDEDRRHGN